MAMIIQPLSENVVFRGGLETWHPHRQAQPFPANSKIREKKDSLRRILQAEAAQIH